MLIINENIMKPTIPVLKGSIDWYWNSSPYAHVSRVVVLDVRVVHVQLPVHVPAHEVRAFVETPHKDRVDLLNVRGDSELSDGSAGLGKTGNQVVGVQNPVFVT